MPLLWKRKSGPSMKLRIHIWGGFGSQLYALALLFRLQNLSVNRRRVELVFHNGGVTLREPEILDLVPSEVSVSVVKDFLPNLNFKGQTSPGAPRNTWLNSLKKYFKIILSRLGLVVDLSKGYKQLRCWTLSVRGHYKYLPISADVLQQILSCLNRSTGSSSNSPAGESLVVHYRLGDLVGLKTTIPQNTLVSAINANITKACKSIILYTDSTNLVNQFPRFIEDRLVEIPDDKIRVMFMNALDARIFVGTDSKISFWLTYLRLAKDRFSINVMPSSFKPELEITLGDSTNFQNLKFY